QPHIVAQCKRIGKFTPLRDVSTVEHVLLRIDLDVLVGRMRKERVSLLQVFKDSQVDVSLRIEDRRVVRTALFGHERLRKRSVAPEVCDKTKDVRFHRQGNSLVKEKIVFLCLLMELIDLPQDTVV